MSTSGRRAVRSLLILVLGIALVLPAAAAAQEASPASEPTNSSATEGLRPPTFGFTYDLYTYNPLRVCGCGAEYEWLALNYDMLLNFDKKTMAAAPGLATEVPSKENGGISEDSTVYTFKIRQGVTWQDGEPFTAQDVKFTYDFVENNGIGAFANYLPDGSTFEAPDDQTFIWTLPGPSVAPLAPPYVPILPEHIWAQFDGDKTAAKAYDALPAVGTGPFQLVEWKQGQFWRVVANKDYWGDVPKVDEIIFRVFDNQETMALALRSGEIDFADSVIPQIGQSLENEPNIEVRTADARGFMNFAFNFRTDPSSTAHPAIHDLTLRMAIAHAIDKQALVDRVLMGQGVAGTSIMPPVSRWHWEPSPEELQGYDPDLANQMLDEAGYKRGSDGIRVDPKSGEPLVFEVYAASDVPDAPPSARIIASWLKEIGISVKVKPASGGEMNRAWGAGTFDAYLWGWNPDPDPDFILSIFTKAECMNWSDGCYSDPAYDKMYKEQQAATSEDERMAIVQEMEQFVYNDVAQLILYYAGDIQAYRTDTYTGYVAVPEPNGYLAFGYVPYTYMSIRPVATAGDASSAASEDSASLLPWIIGLVVLVLIIAAVVFLRRRGEENRA